MPGEYGAPLLIGRRRPGIAIVEKPKEARWPWRGWRVHLSSIRQDNLPHDRIKLRIRRPRPEAKRTLKPNSKRIGI
jgi:hypothetical protein